MKTNLQEPFKCAGRRNLPEYPGIPKQDHWRELPNGDHSCSFCGSMHPGDFEKILTLAADPETRFRYVGRAPDQLATFDRIAKDFSWMVADPDNSKPGEMLILVYRWHGPRTQKKIKKFNKLMLLAGEHTLMKIDRDLARNSEES